jgi:plasmid stability protein
LEDVLKLELGSDELGALSERAQSHGRSPEQEAVEIIRQTLAHADRRQYLVEWSRRIRAMTPPGVQQTDSLKLLREDRNR